MSLVRTGEGALAQIDAEILGEIASSLGNAGRKAEACLRAMREEAAPGEARERLRRTATEAVYAYFIQRELCGFRRHDDIIRDLAIPREVLVRLGAR